jgi:hypothetical protein
MNNRLLAPARGGFVRAMLRGLVALWLVLAACAAPAQTPARNQAAFDHLKTGFALSGKHVQTRCESCHQNGIFKGTPRDCASCHLSSMRFARGNVVMPQQHLPTQLSCDSCHGTQSFVGARFNHQGVAPGTCTSCHNGSTGSGKPSGHIVTSASCDTCHRSNAWSPATSFDHVGVLPGTCTSCHGAGRASAKPARHMPTNAGQSCDDCHRSFTAWRPTAWTHAQMAVAGQCASCHTGGYPPADGRPANHIPYATVAAAASANCDTCHRGGYSTWANGRLHASVSLSSGCASCHTGTYLNAVGKPNNATHATVTGNCESCHRSTSTWAGARTDHASFNASTNCASCHNGSAATGKPGNHVPTTASCFSCHNVSPAGWTPTKWNHTQVTVTAACASCHTGGYPPADGRPANHIPYQTVAMTAAANCDSCHRGSFTTWGNGRLHANFSISTGCVSCHSGAYLNAVGKPSNTTHATVTGNCESCHRSTASWSGARVDHSTYGAATTCSTCHNGSGATGKPGNHIPTTANCFSCHNVSPAGWTPTKWNHTQVTVTAACASCHTGGYPPADGRPANHIPYQTVAMTAAANCDSCHRGSYTTWGNGRLHSNFSISTGCVSCHSGAYLNAVGKPNNTTHATITGNCESCHRSTASWATVTFAHSPANAVGTGTCDTCHNGSSARGKPATHIPVPAGAARCDSCHRSQASFTASVTMNHAVVTTGQCRSCHNGSYLSAGTQGALAKPSNHIPEASQLLNGAAMDCSTCHTSTTSWGTMTMNHNNTQGNGAGWCKGCHTRGQTWLGIGETKSLTHERSTGVTDCSQSGCHRPLGTRGSPYRNWD